MRKSKANNLIVGARVLIDFHDRWEGARPEFREQLRKECENNLGYGQEAVVVDVDMAERQIWVRLVDGSLEPFRLGWVRILELPKSLDEIEQILRDIRHLLSKGAI